MLLKVVQSLRYLRLVFRNKEIIREKLRIKDAQERELVGKE